MIKTIAIAALAAVMLVKVFKSIEEDNYRKMFTSGAEFALLLLALADI